jgi:hypothetical protein
MDVVKLSNVKSPHSQERGIWFGPSHEVRDRLAVAPSYLCDGSSWDVGEEGSLVFNRAKKCTIVEFGFLLSKRSHHGTQENPFVLKF